MHDGVLSVQNGDTITATYIDASDGGGGFNLPRVVTAQTDCVVPVITKVQATHVAGTFAKITWTTNEPATSVVHHGTTPPPATTTSLPATVLGHGVDVTGLTECTPYVYSVDSTDVVGNFATDNAAGAYYKFTTGKNAQVSYASADTPIPIPDNSPVGATSTITVPDARTVQDVNVTLNVQHTFDGDLTFTLTTPTGLSILLANPHGGSGTVPTPSSTTRRRSDPPAQRRSREPSVGLAAQRRHEGESPGAGSSRRSIGRPGHRIDPQLDAAIDLRDPAVRTARAAPGRRRHTCVTGGAASSDSYWDAGRRVR